MKESVCALQWQPGRWQVLGSCNTLAWGNGTGGAHPEQGVLPWGLLLLLVAQVPAVEEIYFSYLTILLAG